MIPARYVLVLVSHIGLMIVYGLRVNMSVAIIAMINSTYADSKSSGSLDPECQAYSNSSVLDKDGSFAWDQNSQGLILSSFFYGYIVAMFPSALLCTYVKSTTAFGISILCTSILTLLTPVVANYSFNLLIALRVLEGLCEGIIFPSMHSILAKWAPSSELTWLAAMIHGGIATGSFVAFSTAGILCNSNFLGGWPSIFYIFGSAGILWYLVWFSLIYELPSIHPRISNKEKQMLEESVLINPRDKHESIPWKAIFTSLPVWSIIILNLCGNWYIYTMLTGLPTFFKEVLNFRLNQNGVFSSLPHAISPIFGISSGVLCDWLINHKVLSRTHARKVFTIFGLTLALGLSTAMTFCGCHQILLLVTLLVLGYGFCTAGATCYGVNHIDLAPKYADILMGITNTFGTLSGCLCPLVFSALTEHNPTRRQWQKVMYISSGIAIFGGLFFVTFGDGSRQSWADQSPDEIDTQSIKTKCLADPTDDREPLIT